MLERLPPRWFSRVAVVSRAMVVSVSQIATYDQAKASLGPHLNGVLQHLVAGLISALTFTTVSMPLDTVKTRVQQVTLCCPLLNEPERIIWLYGWLILQDHSLLNVLL